MSAPAISELPTLTKLRNYNNILYNEYFGQINVCSENWMNMVGSINNVIHEDLIEPIQVKLLNIQLLTVDDLSKFDLSIFINMENILTIGELCGFDNKTFKSFKFYTGFYNQKSLGVYIFKNLNYMDWTKKK